MGSLMISHSIRINTVIERGIIPPSKSDDRTDFLVRRWIVDSGLVREYIPRLDCYWQLRAYVTSRTNSLKNSLILSFLSTISFP